MSQALVAKRKVTLFHQQTSQREFIETDARTWGELKTLIKTTSNKKFVLRESKHTLQAADAVLPEGNFFIFVYPEESKGGAKKVAKKTAKKAAKKTAKKAAKKTAKKAVKKVAAKGKTKRTPARNVASVVNDVKVSKEVSEEEELAALANESRKLVGTFR
jgi:hypothetical protein